MNRLNQLGQRKFPPQKSLSDLLLGVPHPITTARRLPNCKWSSVLVELEAGFAVFLPPRIAKDITDEEIGLLSEHCLVYTGEEDIGKPNKVQQIKFVAKMTSLPDLQQPAVQHFNTRDGGFYYEL